VDDDAVQDLPLFVSLLEDVDVAAPELEDASAELVLDRGDRRAPGTG